MFYIKRVDGVGKEQLTPITEEKIYCACPGCGKEVSADTLMYDLQGGMDIDLDDGGYYCQACEIEARDLRDMIEDAVKEDALIHMTKQKLIEVYNLIAPFAPSLPNTYEEVIS